MRLPVIQPQSLPPAYATWIRETLGSEIPREEHATCDDCAMVLPGDSSGDRTAFREETKCCTYVPELPNFTVGRILRDARDAAAHGRTTVAARIERGVGVTPLGLMQDERFKLLYQHTIAGFGRSTSLLCPHFDARIGGCSIWEHREAACATWFCKHTRGGVGKAFWNRLHLYLQWLEQAVARHCLVEVGFDADALALLFPVQSPRDAARGLEAAQVDGGVDESVYRAVWGTWSGRERALYERCAEVADTLTSEQVRAIAGAEGALRARLVTAAFERRMSSAFPDRLRVGSFFVLGITAEVCRVQSYSFLDPLDLPRPMFDALPAFDGRPTREALADAEARAGDTFGDDGLRKLIDFGILVGV